eukprot:1950118-Pleurochrysis_carterae.AAC.1
MLPNAQNAIYVVTWCLPANLLMFGTRPRASCNQSYDVKYLDHLQASTPVATYTSDAHRNHQTCCLGGSPIQNERIFRLRAWQHTTLVQMLCHSPICEDQGRFAMPIVSGVSGARLSSMP